MENKELYSAIDFVKVAYILGCKFTQEFIARWEIDSKCNDVFVCSCGFVKKGGQVKVKYTLCLNCLVPILCSKSSLPLQSKVISLFHCYFYYLTIVQEE